jgi:alkylation response protein AidB-like acyl-CoA dehydrogenase
MIDWSYLDWPFFAPEHGELARALDGWAGATLGAQAEPTDVAALDRRCRDLVRQLGAAGWLSHAVPLAGASPLPQARHLCLIREVLARHDALADFAFAMQGLGSAPIALAGTDAMRARWLPRTARGESIAAFALSEPEAGSDVAALALSACADGATFVLSGDKTWISNGGIADFYCVFARTGEAPGARGISAFVVEADNPGLFLVDRPQVIAPHPMARLRFDECRVPRTALLGELGRGFHLAMATLDIFRASVAAAALGFARRAFAAAMAQARDRRLFGQRLGDLQLTQAALADMVVDLDAAALLTYRAAWQRDHGRGNNTLAAAQAKLAATEAAQRVIDRAVQLHGAHGVTLGHPVERLYREIRPLRIYEGASEVQRLVIARELLKAAG